MENGAVDTGEFIETSKRLARRLLTIGENRLELLTVELQEEREHFLRAIMLSLGVAIFCLLTGITFTAMVVVIAWPYAPITVLVSVTGLYGVTAYCLYRRLVGTTRGWQNLPATLDQLQKDRACLEKILE